MKTALLTIALLLAVSYVRCEEESDDTIKPGQVKPGQAGKCGKCLKQPYQDKHPDFCDKCSSAGLVEEKVGAKPGDCRRCKEGSKYSRKNAAFCTQSCGGTVKKVKNTKKKMDKKKKYLSKQKSVTLRPVYAPISQSYVQPHQESLGPLGQIFQSMVVANTWTR